MPTSNEALTFAEHRLWTRLSNRQLAGLAFQRKAIVGAGVADFFSLAAKLVVEVDGPDSADASGDAATDLARQAYFERLGLHVLRFTAGQVLEDLDWVMGAIRLASERQINNLAIRTQLGR